LYLGIILNISPVYPSSIGEPSSKDKIFVKNFKDNTLFYQSTVISEKEFGIKSLFI
jgi:hypothetical protein